MNLIPELGRYLAQYRPVLVAQATIGHGPRGRAAAGDALWVSTEGSAMSQRGIFGRIVEFTAARLSKRMNPHLFRTSAATSVALNDPDHLHINKSNLGHTRIATSERYYNHAQAVGASGCYQDQILAMRRELTSPERRPHRDRRARQE